MWPTSSMVARATFPDPPPIGPKNTAKQISIPQTKPLAHKLNKWPGAYEKKRFVYAVVTLCVALILWAVCMAVCMAAFMNRTGLEEVCMLCSVSFRVHYAVQETSVMNVVGSLSICHIDLSPLLL